VPEVGPDSRMTGESLIRPGERVNPMMERTTRSPPVSGRVALKALRGDLTAMLLVAAAVHPVTALSLRWIRRDPTTDLWTRAQ
jgi:hypothetical protein